MTNLLSRFYTRILLNENAVIPSIIYLMSEEEKNR